MRRNSDLSVRYPGYYRHDLMNRRREQLGLSIKEVAKKAQVNFDSTRRVFLGEASSKKVWPVAEALQMNWSLLHDFSIKESDFRLAVDGQFHRAMVHKEEGSSR